MNTVSIQNEINGIPTTILGEVEDRKNQGGLDLAERFRLVGAQIILGPGITRSTSTKAIAEQCGAHEAALYKQYSKPLIDRMVSVALASLKADFIGPRHDILEALARRLALNGELDLMARLRHWAQAYGKIANPASVLKIEAPGLNTNGEFLGRHVEMIGRSLQIIGKGRGVADDPNLGSSSFALLAAYDMASDVGDLGGFAEVVLARKLRLSR